MHISAQKHRMLSGLIELLSADYPDGKTLRAAIGTSLLDLLDADLYSSYAWNPQKRAFERGVAINLDGAYVEKYENYFQHRHATTAGRWVRCGASIVSAVIPRRDLMRTEIYNDFLRPSGHYYGVNLFAFDGRHSIGDVRLWRKNGRPDFGQDDVELLALVERGFITALKRAEQGATAPTAATFPKLSPREAEVAQLAAQGLADKEIARRAREDEVSRRLMTVPGIGPISATAIAALAPPAETFAKGRDFAAWLGLTPLQRSTGGKHKLGSTSKMGERTLRRLLIIGSSAVVQQASKRGAPKGSWLEQMLARKPRMLVTVALANKMARIVWALLVKQENYRAPVAAKA